MTHSTRSCVRSSFGWGLEGSTSVVVQLRSTWYNRKLESEIYFKLTANSDFGQSVIDYANINRKPGVFLSPFVDPSTRALQLSR